ncbi:MAG: hypothetical protein H6Q52_2184 [Deltaproteobacteria bacterium]|nr:hypothetical protein [Deltaproteobacteria bacterium]
MIDTDYRKSRGACWARHEAQKLYAGEDYVLQIDSHMRFVHGWDLICIDGIRHLQQRGNRKVIISNLMPSYEPEDDQNLPQRYLTYKLGPFNEAGSIQLKASTVSHPPRERFSPGYSISAAFLFSIGDLYRDVIIDPDLYFEGEEISFAVRAYTHGYDIYHCHYPIVYHYYLRKPDRKHWDDHGDWGNRSVTAKERMRSLLMGTGEVPDLGPYGLGAVRSLQDYERHAGVDFKDRIVNDPDNPPIHPFVTGPAGIRSRLAAKKIGTAQIDPFSYCNARCWYCPVRYYPQPVEARHHMPTALFERIIKNLCEERDGHGVVNPAFDFIYTAHYNEILLYRHLPEMFQVLRRYNLRTMVLTNGIALSDKKVELIGEYNDVVGGQVCVNISAFEEERWVLNTIAGNGLRPAAMCRVFRRTMKNIDYASRNLASLSIQINEPDPAEAGKQANIARQMFPAAAVRTSLTLSDRAGILHDAGVLSNRDEIAGMSAGKSQIIGCRNTFTGIDGRHFGWLHVNALGKALLCCNDYRFDYTFGDFATEELKDIWLSGRHVEVIEKSFREICRTCSMAVWR